MAKQPVISSRLESGWIITKQSGFMAEGTKIKIDLPEGCLGIMFVFESKKAARQWDKDSPLIEIEKFER